MIAPFEDLALLYSYHIHFSFRCDKYLCLVLGWQRQDKGNQDCLGGNLGCTGDKKSIKQILYSLRLVARGRGVSWEGEGGQRGQDRPFKPAGLRLRGAEGECEGELVTPAEGKGRLSKSGVCSTGHRQDGHDEDKDPEEE